MAANLQIRNCEVCKRIIYDDDKFLCCDGFCTKNYHVTCLRGISVFKFKKIFEMRDCMKWFCYSCSDRLKEIRQKMLLSELNSNSKILCAKKKKSTTNLGLNKNEKFQNNNRKQHSEAIIPEISTEKHAEYQQDSLIAVECKEEPPEIIEYKEESLSVAELDPLNVVEYEKNTLTISNVEMRSVNKNFMCTKDAKESHTEEMRKTILQEDEHLLDTKHSIYITEPKIVHSDDVDKPSYTSMYEDNAQPVTSIIERGISSLLDENEYCTSFVKRKEDREEHNTSKKDVGVSPIQAPANNQHCYCNKVFFNARNLKIHVNAEHKIKNFKCHQCNKNFINAKNVKSHIDSVHNKIKNYACHVCQKQFYKLNSLKNHVSRVHEKIKNFECEECFRTFYEISELNKHIYGVHKKLKRFECNVCCKQFFAAGNLSRHINEIHTKIKKFECTECHKMYSQSSHLKRHINQVHKEIL